MSDKCWEPRMFCHTFTLSHSLNLSFNHSRHAEQLLFSCLSSKLTVYSRKCQCFFFDSSRTITLPCEFRSHRAGSQLKNVWTSDKSWEPGTLTRSHALTLSLSHSITLDMLNNFCFHVYAHSLSFTLSHSHTLSISHSLSLNMRDNFCFCLIRCLYVKMSMVFFWQNFLFMLFLGPHHHPLHWH